MNVITLRNRARRKSGVSSSDYADSSLLEDFNQAYYTLAPIIANLDEDFYEEQNTKFDLALNSSLYSLPTDCIAVKQLRLAYSTPSSDSDYKVATPYGPEDVGIVSVDEENIPTNNPIYDITNNYIRLKPKPTAAVTNGGKLWYIAMPSALVNTGDSPVLPIQYHEIIANYGAAQMAFKYEKWNKYKVLDKAWNDKLAELSEVLADRDRNKPVRFKNLTEAASGPRTDRRELPGSW